MSYHHLPNGVSIVLLTPKHRLAEVDIGVHVVSAVCVSWIQAYSVQLKRINLFAKGEMIRNQHVCLDETLKIPRPQL